METNVTTRKGMDWVGGGRGWQGGMGDGVLGKSWAGKGPDLALSDHWCISFGRTLSTNDMLSKPSSKYSSIQGCRMYF